MNKNKILAALLLASVVEVSQAGLPTGATLFDVNVPSISGGPTIGLTALHWETSTSEYDYALTYPPNDLGLPLGDNGIYHSLDPDSRWNLKLSIGYIFPCTGNDLTFSYTGYHQRTTDFVRLDPLTAIILPTLSDEWPTVGSVIITNPLLGEPTTLDIIANPNLTTANTTINHNVFNLDYGQSINVGCQTRLKYYAGLRYANISNQMNVIYNFSQVDTTGIDIAALDPDLGITVSTTANYTETVHQTSNMGGIGPQLGVDVNYYLRWGFGLVGSLSSSLLVSEVDSSLTERFERETSARVVATDIFEIPVGTIYTSFAGESSSMRHPDKHRIVPNIDAKLGIDYSYQYCNCSHTKLNIEFGYMLSHYFNSVDRLSEVTIDEAELNTRHVLDAHFEGIYFGVQVNM